MPPSSDQVDAYRNKNHCGRAKAERDLQLHAQLDREAEAMCANTKGHPSVPEGWKGKTVILPGNHR